MAVSGRTKLNSKYGKGDIFCQPCQSDDDYVEADGFCETCNEYFCSSCLKVHRKQSMSKNHVIKEKDQMPRDQVQTDPCSALCEVHKTEVVKYFCNKHDLVGCVDCLVLEHKSCKVELVSDISGNYSNSNELHEIKQKIKELEKKINASKVEIKKSLKIVDEIKAKVIKEIKTFRMEIDTYLDKVEAELVKEVEEINVKDVSQQRRLFDECVAMENELKKFRTKLDQYTEQTNQLFVTAKQAQTKLASCQRSVENIDTESQIHVYSFEQCKDMNNKRNNNTPIGRITTQIQKFKVHITSKKDIVIMKTQYVKKINVQATNESDCWITGIAMLSPDEIVLTDYTNKSLKILNVRSNTITSILNLPCQPFDVTVINSETVAVTLPQGGQILFVNSKSGLSKSHSLKVRQWCRGIDHRNGIIAVSFESRPPAVQILNMKGDILHDVKEKGIFHCPWYISFSDDNNLFVSDCMNNEVYELTIDGHLKATMKGEEFTSPRGLAVTSNGTVVVCCHGTNHRVSMIVQGTREIKQLSVEHVQSPSTILVCEEDSIIYICEFRQTADDNFIKVFNLV